MVDPNIWSWQVDRATYDEILLRNAVEQGADVREGAFVKRIFFDGDRAIGAEWTNLKDSAVLNTVKFRYVVDAIRPGRRPVAAAIQNAQAASGVPEHCALGY